MNLTSHVYMTWIWKGIQQYASESLVSSNLKEALAFFGVLFTIIHDTQTLCVIGIWQSCMVFDFIFCPLRTSEKHWSVDVDWLLSLLVVIDSMCQISVRDIEVLGVCLSVWDTICWKDSSKNRVDHRTLLEIFYLPTRTLLVGCVWRVKSRWYLALFITCQKY